MDLTQTELTEYLEIARLALQDADFFDTVAEACDLSDEYMQQQRDKLQLLMESEEPITLV